MPKLRVDYVDTDSVWQTREDEAANLGEAVDRFGIWARAAGRKLLPIAVRLGKTIIWSHALGDCDRVDLSPSRRSATLHLPIVTAIAVFDHLQAPLDRDACLGPDHRLPGPYGESLVDGVALDLANGSQVAWAPLRALLHLEEVGLVQCNGALWTLDETSAHQRMALHATLPARLASLQQRDSAVRGVF
jgi:hypothetical protein